MGQIINFAVFISSICLLVKDQQRFVNVLQVVVDEVEAFRSRVNDAVAVIDCLDKYKQTWLDQTSCLKAQIARSRFFIICIIIDTNFACFMTSLII